MITFVRTCGEEAQIHIVCGNESKAVSAVNGQDVVNIDNALNDIVENKKIKHVNLVVTYTDSESNVHSYLKSIETGTDKKKMCRPNGACEEGDCECDGEDDSEEMDYTCPECGEKDVALYDKFGNKFPCLTCIKIDVAKQLQKKQKMEEEKKQKAELEEYNKKLDDAFKDT